MKHPVFLKPVYSEKSLADQKKSKYHFWVHPQASRSQIRSAFVSVFSVQPLKINTLLVKGKTKTNWKKNKKFTQKMKKKAIITIAKDQKIKLLSPK